MRARRARALVRRALPLLGAGLLVAGCASHRGHESEVRATETPVVPPPPEITPPIEANAAGIPLPLPPCLPEEPAKVKHRIRHKEATKAPVTTPAPAPAPAASAPTSGAPVNAQVGELSSAVLPILGKRVQGPHGEDLGRVVDVLADAEGRVRVAIIDFGGFLGVGNRRIAVEWPLLHFDPANDARPVTLDVTRQKLQSAPEFRDARRPRVLMPPAAPASPAEMPAGSPPEVPAQPDASSGVTPPK